MAARWSLVLTALALAGCTAPLNAIDTGHCHADHNQQLNTQGDPWSFMKVLPHEDVTYRAYDWALNRSGGCVTDVHVQFHGLLNTDTARCGGVELSASKLYADVALDGKDQGEGAPQPLGHETTREWLYDQTFEYPAGAAGDQPHAWNATFELLVPHDALALASNVDDCVHRALRVMDGLGTDKDFKA